MSALPRYVSEFKDRHGKTRRRFRRAGCKPAYIRADLGTPAFEREYAKCLATPSGPEPYREPSSLTFQLSLLIAAGLDANRSYVYFIEADGLIKIGQSRSIVERFKKLQTASSLPLMLLGVRPGSAADERELHLRFADDRVRGEWFRETAELRKEAVNGKEHCRTFLSHRLQVLEKTRAW